MEFRDSVAGAFGSVCLVYGGLPLDTVKLRLATQGERYGHSITKAFRSMLRSEGVISLWRGALPALASATVENTVLFTANGWFCRQLSADGSGDESKLSLAQHALAGAASGCFSATAICFPELIKCRMQFERSATGLPALRRALRDVWQQYGFRAPTVGLSALLARDLPFNTLFFLSYRSYCRGAQHLLGRKSQSELGSIEVFLCGGMAGSTAWSIVYPFDVAKSFLQTQGASTSQGTSTPSAGPISRFVSLVRTEGAGVLYRGWSAAVMRAFVANAFLFLGVETAQRAMESAWPREEGPRGGFYEHEDPTPSDSDSNRRS